MAKKLAKKKSVTKAHKKVKVVSGIKKLSAIKKSFTKTELLQCLMSHTGLPKKEVVQVLDALQTVIYAHVKGGCAFSYPGVYKITVVKKPATKARKGISPFTKLPIVFQAKPARKVIKIRPLKKLKAAV